MADFNCTCNTGATSLEYRYKGDNVHEEICSNCGGLWSEADCNYGPWMSTDNEQCYRTCEDCGHSQTQGHSFGEYFASPDSAEHYRTCSNCNTSFEEAHVWEDLPNSKQAKCTKCGVTCCDVADSHTSEVTTAATCTASGVRTYWCGYCSSEVKTENIPQLDHDTNGVPEYEWSDNNTKCTAFERCSYGCGTKLSLETGTVSGEYIEPSCKNGGYFKYTAQFQNYSDTTKEVSDGTSTTGHNWSDWRDIANNRQSRECNICGQTETRDAPVTSPENIIIANKLFSDANNGLTLATENTQTDKYIGVHMNYLDIVKLNNQTNIVSGSSLFGITGTNNGTPIPQAGIVIHDGDSTTVYPFYGTETTLNKIALTVASDKVSMGEQTHWFQGDLDSYVPKLVPVTGLVSYQFYKVYKDFNETVSNVYEGIFTSNGGETFNRITVEGSTSSYYCSVLYDDTMVAYAGMDGDSLGEYSTISFNPDEVSAEFLAFVKSEGLEVESQGGTSVNIGDTVTGLTADEIKEYRVEYLDSLPTTISFSTIPYNIASFTLTTYVKDPVLSMYYDDALGYCGVCLGDQIYQVYTDAGSTQVAGFNTGSYYNSDAGYSIVGAGYVEFTEKQYKSGSTDYLTIIPDTVVNCKHSFPMFDEDTYDPCTYCGIFYPNSDSSGDSTCEHDFQYSHTDAYGQPVSYCTKCGIESHI